MTQALGLCNLRDGVPPPRPHEDRVPAVCSGHVLGRRDHYRTGVEGLFSDEVHWTFASSTLRLPGRIRPYKACSGSIDWDVQTSVSHSKLFEGMFGLARHRGTGHYGEMPLVRWRRLGKLPRLDHWVLPSFEGLRDLGFCVSAPDLRTHSVILTLPDRSAVSYTAGKSGIGTVKSLYKIPIPRE